MKSKLVLSVVTVTLFLCMATPLLAEDATVLRVVVVQTANPAFRAWLKELDKMRKIVSDSLYTESKP